MNNKRTIRALEELVKTENTAVAALDFALDAVEDNRLRKQYRKWRDSHVRQADALNDRLEDLGGMAIIYDANAAKSQPTLLDKLAGVKSDGSVSGMRVGAERTLKRYIDHLDDIDDPKTLSVIRRNLEAKKDEIAWYEDQIARERVSQVGNKIEESKEKVKEMTAEIKSSEDSKKAIEKTEDKGGGKFPLLLVLGVLAALAFFLLRRGEESDYDDYGEDAFRYEGDEASSSESYSMSGTHSNAGNGTGAGDYNSSVATGDVASAS